MTAEMLVMNRSAVALAADSAVTISSQEPDGGSIRKIYANANKVFEPIRGRPVGIMIFDSADLVHVPWETIIKIYRSQRVHSSFTTLEEYAKDFLEFLDKELQSWNLGNAIAAYEIATLKDLAQWILQLTEERAHEAVHDGTEKRLNGALRLAKLTEILQEIETEQTEQQVADWAEGVDESEFLNSRKDELLESMPDGVQGRKMAKTLRLRLLRTSIGIALRDPAAMASRTGVVIAGFGNHEVFPTCLHFEIGGVFAGRLVASTPEVTKVTVGRPSVIIPFAQSTEATTFLMGIDPNIKRAIEVWWQRWLSEHLGPASRRIVQKETSTIDESVCDEIEKQMNQFGLGSWNLFADFMNEWHSSTRLGPIEASAAFLSKEEIAHLAETMVNLASLRDRVSIDRDETVGGATDVAVISPGDGFVWIKRKHYFELNANPTWAPRQYIHGVLSKYEATPEGVSHGTD